MPSSYTSSLRLTLPATGELSGTWGTTVNTGITELTDASIAGYVSVAMTDADYTLTVANGTTDQARRMMLNMTGTLTLARNVICPTASKVYIIKNATTGGFAITLKTSAGTGISIPNGSSMLLMCDGTNVVNAVTYFSSLTLGTALPATSGGTGQSSYAIGDILFASTSTALSKLADVATGNAIISGGIGVAPSYGKIGLTTHVSGTLPVANGGTGITSFGTGIATWLGTPSSANLAAAVTDETGSGALVFATSPSLVTPLLGTPTSGNFSTGSFTWPTFNQNTTGTAAGLSVTLVATSGGTGQSSYAVGDILFASTTTALSKLADVATGNALISGGIGVAPSYGKIGLTTHVSGTLPVANGGTGITSFGAGVATWLGTPSSANLAAAVTDETGSGALVFGTSPTLSSPTITGTGTAAFGNLSYTGTLTGSTGVINIGTGQINKDASGNVGIGTSTNTNASLLTVNGTISETVASTQWLIASQYDVGTAPNEIPLNGFLGDLAFQNRAAVSLGDIAYTGTLTGSTGIVNIGSGQFYKDASANVQVTAGAIVVYAPTPATISAVATLTNADIQTQIINTTGTTYTVTMPLGTTLETLVPWLAVNTGYNFTVINTASGTITMAVNTGVTSLGGLTIATGISAQFRIRRTAANTFIMYRLS